MGHFTRTHNAVSRHGSSKTYVKGRNLASVDLLSDLSSRLDSIVRNAVAQTEALATEELRAEARLNPVWESLADSLYVQYNGESFDYVSTSPLASDIEFGTPDQPPVSLLRRQASSKSDQNKRLMNSFIKKGANIAD